MANKPTVELLADADLQESWRVMSRSFGNDAPFVNIYFPNHDTPAGEASGVKRLAAWKNGAPNSTFLKSVVKDASGSEVITGFAVWTHMTEPPPAELEKVENVTEVWPDENDREFMTRLWRSYVGPRSEAVQNSGGKGVYVLELLAVDPNHQRQGAGKALVERGINTADEKGLESVVEGTLVGRPLYEKCGMQPTIEEMSFDVGDEFKNRRKPVLTFLRRPAKS